MLDIPVDGDLIGSGKKEDYLEHARLTSERVQENFPRVKRVAYTFRFDHGAGGIQYYTALFAEEENFISPRNIYPGRYWTRWGAGDCFMAGLIAGWPL